MVRVQALFLKNTPGIFVRKKNKNAFAKSEKKDQTEKKRMNSLAGLSQICEISLR